MCRIWHCFDLNKYLQFSTQFLAVSHYFFCRLSLCFWKCCTNFLFAIVHSVFGSFSLSFQQFITKFWKFLTQFSAVSLSVLAVSYRFWQFFCSFVSYICSLWINSTYLLQVTVINTVCIKSCNITGHATFTKLYLWFHFTTYMKIYHCFFYLRDFIFMFISFLAIYRGSSFKEYLVLDQQTIT